MRCRPTWKPITRDQLEHEQYLLNILLPLAAEAQLAQAAHRKLLDTMPPSEIPEYAVNEPAFFYRAQLLGLPYHNDVEKAYQSSRAELLHAVDEALQDMDVYSPGFDYRATFEGLLEALFEGLEEVHNWHRVRDEMIALYPLQLMAAADYFAGLQRSTTGAWVGEGAHLPSKLEAELHEQEMCARELKESYERLVMLLPELQRRLDRGAYGAGEHNRFREVLEEFDVARWNFSQVALNYVKGQIYEALLSENQRLEG